MRNPYEGTERLFAASGIAGGALAILNTPLAVFASIRSFHHGQGRAVPDPPAFLAPLLTFADPATVYAAYGRIWAPILLLFLVGAAALYLRLDPILTRGMRTAYSLLMTGLLMLLLGVIADYWLGRDVLGQRLWGLAFLVLTLLGLVLYTVGSTWLGVEAQRLHKLPLGVAGAFIAAPLGFLLTPLVPNAPASELFTYAFAWILAGVHLLRTPRGAPTPSQSKSSAA